jgi:hypothetical protein
MDGNKVLQDEPLFLLVLVITRPNGFDKEGISKSV